MKISCIRQKQKPNSTKMVLKMFKVLSVLLLVGVFTASAAVYPQSTAFSINLRNVTIKQVITEIEENSDFIFLVSGDLNDKMSEKVDLNVEDKSVEEVLKIIASDHNFSYEILENQIVLFVDKANKQIVSQQPPARERKDRERKGKNRRGFTISGTISDSQYGETIISAVVAIKELDLWAVSGIDGKFVFNNVLPGNYTFEVTSMGYVTYSTPISVTKNIPRLNVSLDPSTLLLEDVIVTAQAGGSINSSYLMEKTSIDHLQPSSLADVMQLMPGALTNNPDLTRANTVTIRNVRDHNGLNASGVGLLIDGNKLSNSGAVDGGAFDFRSISTDNVESMEVLTGVLSAQYGDMTSGAILVKTKAGLTPYEVRVKSDPRTKAASINKGFRLPSNSGYLNLNVDYARAFKKNISPVDVFDRTSLGVTYSNTFNKDKTPLRFNFKVNGYFTSNDVTQDPDVSKEDYFKSSTKNFNASIYGSWMLDKPYITAINYNVSGSYQKQESNDFRLVNATPSPTTNTKVPGIAEGYFTDLHYKEDYWQESIPLSFNAKVHGNLNKLAGKTLFSTLLGVEYNLVDNRGKGEYYTEAIPPFFRERSYKEIPSMGNFSLFLEEKVKIPINKSTLELMAGARLTKMIIDGYDYDPTIEPRFNARFDVFKPKYRGAFRKLTFRGGWGIMEKLPSIGLLYPAPVYMDYSLFRYSSSETNKSLAVIQTDIIDELLPYNLKPNRTYNMELGVDFNFYGINSQITYFKEKLVDGITPNSNFQTNTINYYDAVNDPLADLKFENGTLYIKDQAGEYSEHSYVSRNDFKLYNRPDNRGEIDKWGLEYSMSFPKIDALNTTILVNGAYLNSKNTYSGQQLRKINSNDPVNPKEVFPYLAVFNKDAGTHIGYKATRFNTNVNLVTNIPAIRMIVSLTTQFVWFDDSQILCDVGNTYTEDGNGNPIYDDFTGKNVLENVYRDPIYYIDFEGNKRPFSDFHETDDPVLKSRLALLRESPNTSYAFVKNGFKPYMMANIRLTKEVGDNVSLSFYANNFTNYTPIRKEKARPNAIGYRQNSKIYFGAEVKLKF